MKRKISQKRILIADTYPWINFKDIRMYCKVLVHIPQYSSYILVLIGSHLTCLLGNWVRSVVIFSSTLSSVDHATTKTKKLELEPCLPHSVNKAQGLVPWIASQSICEYETDSPQKHLHCDPEGGRGGGGGTPIYFLYRDVPTVRVSFSGSSVLNRVYNFTFLCLKQGCPRETSSFPLIAKFALILCAFVKSVKTQTYVPFLVLWIWSAWSSLEQGKKLQHFLLDRVAKFTSFVSWTGSGFRRVGRTPLSKFLLSTPPGIVKLKTRRTTLVFLHF